MLGMFRSAARRSQASRRLALQLATQLPETFDEARETVDELAELLEGYMVKAPRPLWERRALAGGCDFAAPAALFWTVATFLILGLVAVPVHLLVGYQVVAMIIQATGVACIALVFGRRYGLLGSALAMVLHNILIVPPVLSMTPPSLLELLFSFGYFSAAIIVPTVARHAEALRAAATMSCALVRRAAQSSPPGQQAAG
jgi:K+-sensing histidine kinase KdpD